MEVKQIIKAGEQFIDPRTEGPFLKISEFFFDTIQGEGRWVGAPAAFLRLQGCPVNCKWCDTAAVWKAGTKVSVLTLIDLMEATGLKDRLENPNYHLVITGGSPLLQQNALEIMLDKIAREWGRIPYIEVENECSIMPVEGFASYVSCWNNSPKLSNSGVPEERRVNILACKEVDTFALGYGAECYWKFVVKDENDFQELQETYLNEINPRPEQVFLMPMGANQDEYFTNREKVVELAIKHGVRYSPREHIAIWNQKTGI